MEGYWNAPALTDEVLRRDVVPGEILYRTGDLVYVAKDGYYVYVDRVDRVIKRSGVRISLVELSEVMRGLDGIAAAVCVAYDDDGELGIVAFVVSDAPSETREVLGAARERLPENMLPNRIEFVSELPMTNSGKVNERLLLSNLSLELPRLQ
jgi:acyl-coenzyme A synthetase/AMP-(fatty) acid ligase